MSADRKNSLRLRDLPVLAIAIPMVLILSVPFLLWLAIRTVFYSLVLVVIWMVWLPRGKDVLVVYSDSPNWQEYFETELNPRLEARSYYLNWSEHKQWNSYSLRTLAFDGFAGEREFNPLVIAFKTWKWPRRFRFYRAFRDLKHRNKVTVYSVIDQLNAYINESIPYPELPPRPSASHSSWPPSKNI